MCNFIIRPIKSYATVPVIGEGEKKYVTIERGEAVEVVGVNTRVEVVYKEQTLFVDMEDFVHSFIADPAEIKKVKEEESKWFKSDSDKQTNKNKIS